ncbi:MAG: FHA domain-containing protein, partial [Gemmataceae bacterium]
MMPAVTATLVQLGANREARFADTMVLVVGRSPEADLPVLDVACSRRQFQVRLLDGRYILESLSETSPTFCNGTRVVGPTTINDQTLIDAGTSRFRLVLTKNPVPAAGLPRPQPEVRVDERAAATAATLASHVLPAPLLYPTPVATQDTDLILGRDATQAAVQLLHPLVSRRHAMLRNTVAGLILKDLRSENGTYVNGRRIAVAQKLNEGDRVQIGPFLFRVQGPELIPTRDALGPTGIPAAPNRSTATSSTRVQVDQLELRLGGTLLLQDVAFQLNVGEFVAVIGPSGCGKSTLLKCLSGELPPTGGQVFIDD